MNTRYLNWKMFISVRIWKLISLLLLLKLVSPNWLMAQMNAVTLEWLMKHSTKHLCLLSCFLKLLKPFHMFFLVISFFFVMLPYVCYLLLPILCFSFSSVILLLCLQVRKPDQEANVVFYKDSSTFALYKGKDTALDDFVPYQLFSTNIFLREQDKNQIVKLRTWFANFQIPQGI